MTTTESDLSPETNTNYPDIEIYIKRVSAEDIIQWLQTRFENCVIGKQAKQVTELEVTFNNTTIPVLLVEKAQGIFTSVLFESGQTPWPNDKACALEAYQQFNTEIRCNAESWKEGDAPDEWLSISEDGENLINWPG